MTLDRVAQKLATAIRDATDEHGRPNTFSPGELAWLYDPGMTPMLVGRVLRTRMVDVWKYLGGRDGWGSCPRYENGRVAV